MGLISRVSSRTYRDRNMPILGPRATTNPLIAPADWEEKLPRVENRPPAIVTPPKPTWELYLTGGEGYVGRNGIKSGGIYGHDGQPYIQTGDMVFETHDLIHWHELRNIHTLFEEKKSWRRYCYRRYNIDYSKQIGRLFTRLF